MLHTEHGLCFKQFAVTIKKWNIKIHFSMRCGVTRFKKIKLLVDKSFIDRTSAILPSWRVFETTEWEQWRAMLGVWCCQPKTFHLFVMTRVRNAKFINCHANTKIFSRPHWQWLGQKQLLTEISCCFNCITFVKKGEREKLILLTFRNLMAVWVPNICCSHFQNLLKTNLIFRSRETS